MGGKEIGEEREGRRERGEKRGGRAKKRVREKE